jgi:hypothetical protein
MGALLLEGIPFLPPSFRLLGKQSQMGVCKGCAFALVTPLGSLVYGCLVMCIFGYQSSLCKITPLYPLVVPTLVAYRTGHTLLVPCGLRNSSVTLLHCGTSNFFIKSLIWVGTNMLYYRLLIG